MIHNQIGHQIRVLGQPADVVPRAQPGIDLSVINRIEARIGAIDGPKEWQQMDAAKESSQWPVTEQRLELAKPTARKTIDVCNELDLVLHGRREEVPQ
jgi:hypothetical protein